jgi:hypothetical protein
MKNIFKTILVAATLTVSLPMMAQEQDPQPFKRGLELVNFVPKGQWITGASVGYSLSEQDNYQFFVVEDLSGDSYSFKVSPMLMYAFQDDMAIGARLGYARTMNRLETGSVSINEDTNFGVDNLYSLSHNYSATAAFRNYISMGTSRRFAFFNEVQLTVGGGESKLCNGSGQQLTGTFERNYNVNLGVAPGVVMFLNNFTALEVNVGVLGIGYSETKSTTDQIYVSRRDSRSASLNLNLFSLSFGVAFYL